RAFPMRVLSLHAASGHGGARAARRGEGIERDLLVLEDVALGVLHRAAACGTRPRSRSRMSTILALRRQGSIGSERGSVRWTCADSQISRRRGPACLKEWGGSRGDLLR